MHKAISIAGHGTEYMDYGGIKDFGIGEKAAENEQGKLKEDKELKKATERDIFLSCKKHCVYTHNKCLASG